MADTKSWTSGDLLIEQGVPDAHHVVIAVRGEGVVVSVAEAQRVADALAGVLSAARRAHR